MRPESGEKFAFKGRSLLNSKMIISSMQAQRMLSSGCMGFLASVVDKIKEDKLDLTNVPVMKEFVEVFPQELLGLPPMRKISFEIELLLGTGPISKALYHMVQYRRLPIIWLLRN